MLDPNRVRALLRLLRLVLLCAAWSATADAQPETEPTPEAAKESESAPEAAKETESASRFSLSLKGFGGGLFSEHEHRGGGGGGLAAAFAVLPERWELELGLSLVAARHRDPLGVFELVSKLLFEARGAWALHVLAGPVFSLDFGPEVKSSGGLLLGAGVTYWFNARWGVVSELTYRLLISAGPEVEHVLALALGCTVRL